MFPRLEPESLSVTIPVSQDFLEDYSDYFVYCKFDHGPGKRWDGFRYSCSICRRPMFERIMKRIVTETYASATTTNFPIVHYEVR